MWFWLVDINRKTFQLFYRILLWQSSPTNGIWILKVNKIYGLFTNIGIYKHTRHKLKERLATKARWNRSSVGFGMGVHGPGWWLCGTNKAITNNSMLRKYQNRIINSTEWSRIESSTSTEKKWSEKNIVSIFCSFFIMFYLHFPSSVWLAFHLFSPVSE